MDSNRVILSAKQKALRINLNQDLYGTFAEIGAGQEVVRHFFRAGGASGTIAKAMSAYDKDFSDAIYGEEKNSRYVCESRVHKMLNGSLRRAVIGLSLVGMLTGASAFSVMPALRPASLRSSSHAGRPTSL